MKPAGATYAECLEACRRNVETAIDRQKRSEGEYQTRMEVEVAHWRDYVRYYERVIAENPALADKPVSMGSFGKAPSSAQERRSPPPEGQTSQAPQAPPQAHWSEPREPGSDDDSPLPF